MNPAAKDKRREVFHSDWDIINAVREMLGLDPIAEHNGARGKRKNSHEEEETR